MSLKRAPLSSLTNTTIPTCGSSSIKKRRSESESSDVKTHDSPLQSLRDAFKEDSSALDGKPSLLFDLEGHVTYSQHSVEPSVYFAYGNKMNESNMWNEVLRSNTTPRVTTGFSRNIFRSFAKLNSVPVQQLFAGLEVHGEYINGWATKYDDEHGKLAFHCDKFSSLDFYPRFVSRWEVHSILGMHSQWPLGGFVVASWLSLLAQRTWSRSRSSSRPPR